jgi:hypothetical protein
MITEKEIKKQINKADLNHKQLRELESKLEGLMTEYRFIGFAKYLKWGMMSFAFDNAITSGDINGVNLENACLYYLDNIWSTKNITNA